MQSAQSQQPLSSRGRGSNNSFKPTPLRYANHMAEEACHVARSTARRGLTLALGRCHGSVLAAAPQAGCSPHRRISCLALRTRGGWHRQQHLAHFGFGQAPLRRKYDHPESASCSLAVQVPGHAFLALGFDRGRHRPASPSCCSVRLRGWAVGSHSCQASRRPNDSFKPTPLRGAA